MLKRRLAIVLCLIGVGMTLTAQAQQDQPLTQPTVDAAVSTLLAQTALAPMQQATRLAATQTIQAALNQALTATAQALITPTPTLQTLDATHLNVGSTTEIDLIAGPTGTGAYLAPDGQQFAYLSSGSKTLCVYRGSTQGNCVDISSSGLDSETPRWSPDSRYLVFTQDFFRLLHDSDIWVWDTLTNALRDLTPGPVPHINFLSGQDWTGVDLMPGWLPDGRILFLRYSAQNRIILPPDIYTVAVDGSGLQKLGTLVVSDRFAVSALDVTAKQLVYNYASEEGSNLDGVWISNLDGSSPRQLIHISHDEAFVSGVQMSPDGRFVLFNTVPLSYSTRFTPETSQMRLVDVRLSEPLLIDPNHYVAAAGWSPQGSALVYVTHDSQQPDNDAVFLTNTPGSAGQQLSTLQGRFNVATPRLHQALIWGANDTILLSRSPTTGVVLVQLGS